MKVHSYFGPGFPEVVYHRSLMMGFNNNRINAKIHAIFIHDQLPLISYLCIPYFKSVIYV